MAPSTAKSLKKVGAKTTTSRYATKKIQKGETSTLLSAPIKMSKQNIALTLFYTNRHVFSNFFPCEHLRIDNVDFFCTEQYFMYQKAKVFNDSKVMSLILAAHDPKQVKKLGRQVKNFDGAKWDKVGADAMTTANLEKYRQNPELRRELFRSLGTVLVECSPFDRKWGIGLSINNPKTLDMTKWRGKNLLGNILTDICKRLAKDPAYSDEVKAAKAGPGDAMNKAIVDKKRDSGKVSEKIVSDAEELELED